MRRDTGPDTRRCPDGRSASAGSILAIGRRILDEEARAILWRRDNLDEPFAALVTRLLELRGKVGVTGVGKSGIVGEKIAATLSSTGTPALFLKPVDALHGDLGVLRDDDFLIAISNSGETTEVLAVAGAARAIGVEVAAMTGSLESSLARSASIAIDVGVEREACPLGLAPTASTTVTLAIGDAVAMALLELRGFTAESYARFHPGGALGQRLRYRVLDLMRGRDRTPAVEETDTVSRALVEMTERGNLGVTLVTEAGGRLTGIITDGDLRRHLLAATRAEGSGGEDGAGGRVTETLLACDIMTRGPRSIEPDAPVAEALHVMEVHGITSLAVVDPLSRPIGILHLHDILGRGKILL